MQTILGKIISLAAMLLLLSCSNEQTEQAGSRLFGNGDSRVVNVCNAESTTIYALMRAEAGRITTVYAWKKIPAGTCVSFSDWDSVQAYKAFYFQSERGLYQPGSQTYHYSNDSIVCLPRDASVLATYSYSYDGTNVYNSGNCPDDKIKYATTAIADPGNSKVEYVNDVINITYTLQGGQFFESQRVITVDQDDAEERQLYQRIQNLQSRLTEVRGHSGTCINGTAVIMTKTKILGTKSEDLDKALAACEYSDSDRDNLKKQVDDAKRLAHETLSLLVTALTDLYSRFENFGKTANVTAPFGDDYKDAGVDGLMRPAIDAGISKAGFFADLGGKFKQKLSDFYGQYTSRFIASGLAFATTFASFGTDLGSTPEIDQDKFVDFKKAVEMVDGYFDTLDADKNDGYPFDSPVPEDIRKTVREDIKPNAGAAGVNLEDELKKWHGVLTEQQVMVLEAIRYLGFAFQQAVLNVPGELKAITARLSAITDGAVKVVRDGAICAGKVAAAGDFGDWYEIVNRRDICTGEEITRAGQVFSAAGLVLGSAKFWRAMGEVAGIAVTTRRVFKEVEHLSESVIDIIGHDRYHAIIHSEKRFRPDPSEYLPKEYIEKHLVQFDEGGSRLMLAGNLKTYGPAREDATAFIMPTREFDDILKKCGSDKRCLEDGFGFDVGYLDKDTLVRVDIKDPRSLGLRVPSGTEAGASAKWLPGGKLPQGGNEAVIDLGKAPQSAWTNKPLDI